MSKIYNYAVKASRFFLIFIVVFVIIMFIITRSMVDTHTRRIKDDLQGLYQDDINLTVRIDETIPVELTVPLGDLVDLSRLITDEIPIRTTVPVKTTVRIDQTVRVPVDLPLLGRTIVDLPLDLDIPIDEEIPINTTIKIDPSAFQDPDAVIYINQEIPIDFPLELEISIEDLGLKPRFEGVESLIDTLRFMFLLKKLDWS